MNIYILNTIAIGIDSIDIISKKISITGIIGLSNRKKSEDISDYIYQYEYCKTRNLNFIEVDSYGLNKLTDQEKLLDLEIDIIIVCGWQRLIPDWLIGHCKICIVGSHGSPLGITKGRGRSPQNWALILGLKTFYISIFKIDKGIDSGQIISTSSFDYNEFDDIKTSYYKACLLTANMFINSLKETDFLLNEFEKQNEAEAEYFPQRLPSDGEIDWNRSRREIHNFVKALTQPYPGAFSMIQKNKIRILSVIPFDLAIEDDFLPGTILKIFNTKDLLVKTEENYILITKYTLEGDSFEIKEGMQFASVSFKKQMSSIIERHKIKYKNLPVSKLLSDLCI